MAKGLAAERARSVLSDPDSPHYLPRLCTCDSVKKGRSRKRQSAAEELDERVEAEIDLKALDDETEEGFAGLAKVIAEELGDAQALDAADTTDEEGLEEEWMEEAEVERMMELEKMHIHDEAESDDALRTEV